MSNESIDLLKALAEENRLKILRLLLNNSFCVQALAKRLKITPAAVSQHLQILRNAGLVSGEKRGYFSHYSVNKERIKDTINFLTEFT